MISRRAFLAVLLWAVAWPGGAAGADFELAIEQITSGPRHHFFGYIGHVQNIPWNKSGRYVVALRTDFQDRMPGPRDAADVILIDTQHGYRVRVVDRTLAWNFQQGTMFYWNPRAAETQFFFNDRDPESGHVFTVLFDISKSGRGARVKEYHFQETPFGNSGVAQQGGSFLGINYARLARLRPVTGYPETHDWTEGKLAPRDDGIFKVDVVSGQKNLLVSYRRLRDLLQARYPNVGKQALFINHTLWNREGDRIYFYVRADFKARGKQKLNVPCTIRPDGSELTEQRQYIGGHPEWELGNRIIGSHENRQVLYDTNQQRIVGQLGTAAVFPSPGGDVALSPDANWFVNGYRQDGKNYYVVFRRSDSSHVRTPGFEHRPWTSGALRLDAAPCWNRQNDQILFPAIAADKTRQMFLMRILPASATPEWPGGMPRPAGSTTDVDHCWRS